MGHPRTRWRPGIAAGLTGLSWGERLLMPDAEYLPEGNRNLCSASCFPARLQPGRADRYRETHRGHPAPRWEAGCSPEAGPWRALLENFFYVARGRLVFMGAIAADASAPGS
jgi:hypothetical protein